MRKAWQGWVRLLDGRETGEILALFRILTGFALIDNIASVVLADILDLIWVDVSHGGYRSLRNDGAWLVELLGGASPAVVWTLAWTTMLAGVTLMLGLWGRASAFVGLQGLLALTMLNAHTKGSYDALLGNSLWLLVLARSTTTWSVSCRFWNGRWSSSELIPWWPRGLAVLQLAATYFFTALHKLSAAWTPAGGYSALYFILQQPSWQRWPMEWLAPIFVVTQVATASVWFFELLWPVVPLWMLARACGWSGRVWRRLQRVDLRIPFVVFGVAMHVGITILMEVGPFSAIVLALYPCVLRPDELRRLTARMRTGLR